MLTIRDIREEDRDIFFKMEKEFYGGEACMTMKLEIILHSISITTKIPH